MYEWALTCLQRIYGILDLSPPHTILTDKDKALMAALAVIFSGTKHLLCRWHHNENVKINCRKEFPSAKEDNEEKEWVTFRDGWYHCLNAISEAEYNIRWEKFCDKYKESHPIALDYLNDNWQGQWLWKLAAFGTNTALHFFNTTTSRAEGAHALIKQELGVSTGDLQLVVQKISMILTRQKVKYQQRINKGLFNERRETLNVTFFGLVKGIISRWALTEVLKQKAEIGRELEPCTNTYTLISGLPCKHTILRILNSQDPRLRPENFHRHWFYNHTDFPGPQKLSAFHHIQDPDMNTRHFRARRTAPNSSTLRGLTAAELEEKRLQENTRQQ